MSNFHPDEQLWQRALDVGIDAFFASANDLVVPSEGGWRIDRDGSTHIPADRIGCFGPGGNIGTGANPVHHINFFGRQETTQFLTAALARQSHQLPPLDPERPLPDRRFPRATRAAGAVAERAPLPQAPAAGAAGPAARPVAAPGRSLPELAPRDEGRDILHIVIMDSVEPDVSAISRRGRARAGKRDARPRQPNPEFARVFATYGGARVTTYMPLNLGADGSPTRFGNINSRHEQIKDYTNREKGDLPNDVEMVAFGVDLFETLFAGELRRLYDVARSRQRGQKLDLILTSMIPWIAEKPWEFAYDSGRRSFLATEDVHFVRNVVTSVPADAIPPADGPLRILIASAQPVGFGQLSIEQEVEVIKRGFEPLIEAGLVIVDPLAQASPATLHGALSTGRYNVVHFIGHGEFDDDAQEGYLVFENGRGGELRLGTRSACELFCGRGLSLVFLNACQTGSGGRADFNKGTAQAIVAKGLPALVANQYSVLDSSATSFAQHFYWSLAQGMTVGQSAREARIAVNYSLEGEPIDWAVPVVYARDGNLALCTRPQKVVSVPTTGIRRSSRRATAGRPIRVGVWDIDSVFPALDRTLERMNAAQKVFGFELVDVSAPLDAWYLEERAPDGTPYLWANRVAERLKNKAVELRLNLLACVTRHWMRGDDTLDAYAWWSETKDPPVAVLSVAGFDVLKAEGQNTDRAIANSTVSVLAGFFSGFDTHARAPKTCPLAFDEERDEKVLVSVQKFDAICRRRLMKKMPRELPALEALLRVFAP